MRISDWSSDVCSSDLVGERSIACAKVIQCDADTMRVQQFERSLDIFRPASQEYCFRDFQFQKMRGHLGSMQIAQQTFSKIVLAEFSSSRVQGDMSEVNTCVEPAAHVRDDPVLHSLADRLRYFQILERSGDSQRRLDVFGGIAPAE